MNSFFQSVVQSLSKHSSDAADKLHRFYQPAQTPEHQVSHLNNYLRVQLGMLPCSTVSERECLMDDVSEREWLRLFNKHVAPTIAAYGLPAWK
ncbi:hypothetical protein D3C71_1236980 [compost metagenome]